MGTRHSRRGFSLIEVLVALGIFMMMAVVLGTSYINILNAYELAGRSVVRDEDVRRLPGRCAEMDVGVAD